MLVADVFAVNPMKALWSNYERMDGWVTLIHMFMYFLVFGSMMKTEKIWLWFFRSSLIVSVIMFIIAIGEYRSGGSVAAMTTLGNTIYVAVYFLFNFFFALILFYKDVLVKISNKVSFWELLFYQIIPFYFIYRIYKYFIGQGNETIKAIIGVLRNWLSYIYYIVAMLCMWGIWMTATRGAILGLMGGLFVTAVIIAIFERQNSLIRCYSVWVVISILLVIGGFFAVKNTKFVQQNPILHSFAVISWSNIQGQGQARQLIWPLAIKGFLAKPILGWGQEGFNYVFNKFMIRNCMPRSNGSTGLMMNRLMCLLPVALWD